MPNTKTAKQWLADLDVILLDSLSAFSDTEMLTEQEQQTIVRHLQGARQSAHQ